MDRRAFITSTVGTTLLAASEVANAAQRSGEGETDGSDFYIWRQYSLRNGTGPRRLADYLQAACIPALNRIGHKPIGVFEVVTGLPTPTVFVLTPATLRSLPTIETRLERDEEYVRAAEAQDLWLMSHAGVWLRP